MMPAAVVTPVPTTNRYGASPRPLPPVPPVKSSQQAVPHRSPTFSSTRPPSASKGQHRRSVSHSHPTTAQDTAQAATASPPLVPRTRSSAQTSPKVAPLQLQEQKTELTQDEMRALILDRVDQVTAQITSPMASPMPSPTSDPSASPASASSSTSPPPLDISAPLVTPSVLPLPISPRDHNPSRFLSAHVLSYRQRTRLNKPYTEYQVRVMTASLHWECWKRYSEFETFHKQLKKEVIPRSSIVAPSTYRLPKLPPRKLIGNLREEFLLKRHLALEQYLVAVLDHDYYNTCRSVLTFLGCLEEDMLVKTSKTSSDSAKSKSKGNLPLTHLHLDGILPLIDTGDIVLFRTNGVLQGLQRTFTNSAYDHVGIVIRIPWSNLKPSGLHILESTSDGVRTYNLSRRLKAWHACNAIIAVRQLKNIRRTNLWRTQIDEFVSDVDGLPYGLSLSKLIRKEMGQKREDFFCSELVATAYMRVGVIDAATCSASSFYPSSFNQQNSHTITLQNGAELGPELLIDFIQPAIKEAVKIKDAEIDEDLDVAIDEEEEMAANPMYERKSGGEKANGASSSSSSSSSTHKFLSRSTGEIVSRKELRAELRTLRKHQQLTMQKHASLNKKLASSAGPVRKDSTNGNYHTWNASNIQAAKNVAARVAHNSCMAAVGTTTNGNGAASNGTSTECKTSESKENGTTSSKPIQTGNGTLQKEEKGNLSSLKQNKSGSVVINVPTDERKSTTGATSPPSDILLRGGVSPISFSKSRAQQRSTGDGRDDQEPIDDPVEGENGEETTTNDHNEEVEILSGDDDGLESPGSGTDRSPFSSPEPSLDDDDEDEMASSSLSPALQPISLSHSFGTAIQSLPPPDVFSSSPLSPRTHGLAIGLSKEGEPPMLALGPTNSSPISPITTATTTTTSSSSTSSSSSSAHPSTRSTFSTTSNTNGPKILPKQRQTSVKGTSSPGRPSSPRMALAAKYGALAGPLSPAKMQLAAKAIGSGRTSPISEQDLASSPPASSSTDPTIHFTTLSALTSSTSSPPTELEVIATAEAPCTTLPPFDYLVTRTRGQAFAVKEVVVPDAKVRVQTTPEKKEEKKEENETSVAPVAPAATSTTSTTAPAPSPSPSTKPSSPAIPEVGSFDLLAPMRTALETRAEAQRTMKRQQSSNKSQGDLSKETTSDPSHPDSAKSTTTTDDAFSSTATTQQRDARASTIAPPPPAQSITHRESRHSTTEVPPPPTNGTTAPVATESKPAADDADEEEDADEEPAPPRLLKAISPSHEAKSSQNIPRGSTTTINNNTGQNIVPSASASQPPPMSRQASLNGAGGGGGAIPPLNRLSSARRHDEAVIPPVGLSESQRAASIAQDAALARTLSDGGSVGGASSVSMSSVNSPSLTSDNSSSSTISGISSTGSEIPPTDSIASTVANSSSSETHDSRSNSGVFHSGADDDADGEEWMALESRGRSCRNVSVIPPNGVGRPVTTTTTTAVSVATPASHDPVIPPPDSTTTAATAAIVSSS